MAKKVYTITVKQGNHTIEIDKEYNEYEYALISELFNDIYEELNEYCLSIQECSECEEDEEYDFPDLSLSIEDPDKAYYSIDYETEGNTTFKNELTGAIEHTIDNMSPQECRDLFKAVLDSHIKVNKSYDDLNYEDYSSEENNEMIDFSDVISSRLVNQTGPTDGLKLGSL